MKPNLQEIYENIRSMTLLFEGWFNDVDFIVGVSRGGLIPAAMLATMMDKPLVTAYIDKQDNVYLDRTEWLAGKNVIVIDDIVRTGKTMGKIVELVKQAGVASVHSVCLYKNTTTELEVSAFAATDDAVELPWDVAPLKR